MTLLIKFSRLGLNANIVYLLLQLQDNKFTSHQTMQYWIKRYMDDREKSMKYDWNLKQQFQHLGFHEIFAEILVKSLITNPLSNHQSTKYWATLYIDYMFKYCNDLNMEIPVKSITSNANDLRNKYKTRTWYYRTQNINYWFHGTDQESAKRIKKYGIDLDMGKSGADFSSGKGFYVTPNYELAEMWSNKMRTFLNISAIIVFKNKKNILCGGKEFSKDEQNWKDIVRFYRNEKNFYKAHITKSEGKSFDKLKYIYGPLSFDNDQSKINPSAREKYFQLCLKDQSLADHFYKENIEEIFFINS